MLTGFIHSKVFDQWSNRINSLHWHLKNYEDKSCCNVLIDDFYNFQMMLQKILVDGSFSDKKWESALFAKKNSS